MRVELLRLSIVAWQLFANLLLAKAKLSIIAYKANERIQETIRRCDHPRRDTCQQIPSYGGVGMQIVEANPEVSEEVSPGLPQQKAYGIFVYCQK